MKSRTRHFVATVFAAAAMLPALAGAANVYTTGIPKTANFDVTMRIIADCTISATGIDFGQNQGLLTTAVTGNANLKVTCSNTTPYNIGLNQGNGAGSNGTTRYMSGTGANTGTVKFNLYQTSGGGLWGNTQGNDTVGGTGTGTQQNITVYGEIPVQDTPAPDAYKSTITATVYF